MRLSVNCEQVFEILTRGPFPTGNSHDGDVELHLRACHDCRQLAEALKPAIDLFHESIETDQLDDLPGYYGELCSCDDFRMSDSAVAVRSTVRARRRDGDWWNVDLPKRRRVRRVARALMIGVALSLVLWVVGIPTKSPFQFGEKQRAVALQPDEDGEKLLTNLELPAVCLNKKPASFVERFVNQITISQHTAQASYLCCVECHTPAKENRPRSPVIATLADACRACH